MSSSSSSEAWSDEELDSKKEVVIQPKAEHSAPIIRPRHGEKLSFQAPPGYLPSPHSQELLTTFGRDALKSNAKKELWIIKIPEDVSPSSLDGLVINVPSNSASTLAQLKIQMPVKGSASQTQTKSYSLRSQSSTHRPKENGGTSTQLIAMAGGNSITNAAGGDQRMVEGDSLQVMLPQSSSQQGRYVFAPAHPKHHLRLVLDDDATQRAAPLITSEKRKREQPVGKLTGSFLPAGARADEDEAGKEAAATPSKSKKAKKEKIEAEPVSEAKKEVKKEKKANKKRQSQ